ncbi:MAG: BatA domain-containing protein, partial [Alphaproteobacteria bacterium]
GLQSPEETPQRTPWWLLALRLLIAALVILGLAQPLLNPGAELRGSGPLLLVVDNGWAAARDWPLREDTMGELLDKAERSGKPVMLLPTAPNADGVVAARRLMRAADARGEIRSLVPSPWPSDLAAAREVAAGLALDGSVNVVWLSDGLGAADGDDDVARAFAESLRRLGSLRVITPATTDLPQIVTASENAPDALVATVVRSTAGGAASAEIVASTEDGRLLGGGTGVFANGEPTAQVRLVMPTEVRNRIVRLAIANQPTAAAVFLLDERYRRRPVGFVSGDTSETDQPLLGNLYYLNRALAPYAETRSGTIGELLERPLAMLVLADIGKLTDEQRSALDGWLERGGVLLRFAGPRMAEATDGLLPVRLRQGSRQLGGALSWSQP